MKSYHHPFEWASERVDSGSLDGILSVYRASFSQPPYCETEADIARFSESLIRHSEREGFRCVAARADERLAGFAYGYTSCPGQWWHDLVMQALRDRSAAVDWLEGAFELVTLAVHPDMQGQGLGGALHDAILCHLPRPVAALSVWETAPARRLYLRRGWEPVLAPFYYPGGTTPCIIMRRDLADLT